jgi:hypothetical protein
MKASDPEIFFNTLKALYTNSVAQNPSTVHVQLAEKILTINFSRPELKAYMLGSLSHIRVNNVSSSDITIYCFDSPLLTSFPWQGQQYGVQGTIEGFNTARFQTAYQHGSGAVMMYDRETKEGIYWIRDFTDIPYWERSFPFRSILHWWSRDTYYILLHAAGIGQHHSAALLSGKSGSGKSSTTLSCLLRDDLLIAGDDYVLVDTATCTLYSLYNCAKVEWDNLERLDFLKPLVNTTIKEAEKAMIFMHEACAEKIMQRSKLEYAFIPMVCKANKTSIVKCTEAEVLKSIAPTTMFQLPFGQNETFQKCITLTKKLRPYRIELGTDANEIAAAISEFLIDKN